MLPLLLLLLQLHGCLVLGVLVAQRRLLLHHQRLLLHLLGSPTLLLLGLLLLLPNQRRERRWEREKEEEEEGRNSRPIGDCATCSPRAWQISSLRARPPDRTARD